MLSTSASLLLRIRDKSDQQAWHRFVHIYTPLLKHWARLTHLHPDDANDLVQEVLVIALTRLQSFEYDKNGSFKAWLRKIAENKAREFYRRQAKQERFVIAAQETIETEVPSAAQVFWAKEYPAELAYRALLVMKSEFEPKTWQAAYALIFNERPVLEVAQELGISTNACFIAKSRVLRRLRESLKGLDE